MKNFQSIFKPVGLSGLVLFFIAYSSPLYSQETGAKLYSLGECLQTAFRNNEQVKMSQLETDYYKQIKKTAFELPKTSLVYTQGQFNSIYAYDNIFALSQSVPFPTLLKAQSELGKEHVKGAEIKADLVKAELGLKVKESYYTIQHLLQESRLLNKEDSIYELFLHLADADMAKSDKNDLEKATTVTQAHIIQSHYNEILMHLNDSRMSLQSLMRVSEMPEIPVLYKDDRILVPDTNSSKASDQPLLRYLKEQIVINKQSRRVEQQKGAPDIMFGYFNQSIYGPANIYGDDYFLTTADRLQGFQLGLAFPLYFLPHRAKVKAAGVQEEIANQNFVQTQNDMLIQRKQAINKYLLTQKNIEYYKEYILKNSRQMVVQSLEAFNKHEINYIEYLAIISRSFEIERNYLHMILQNNMSVIQIEYLFSDGKY